MKQNKKSEHNRKKLHLRMSFSPLLGTGLLLAVLLVAMQVVNSSGKNPIKQLFSEKQTSISESVVNKSSNTEETNHDPLKSDNMSSLSESEPRKAENSQSQVESHQSEALAESEEEVKHSIEEATQSEESIVTTTSAQTTIRDSHEEKPKIVENKNKQQWLPNIKVEGIFNPLIYSLDGEYSLYYQALDHKTSSQPLILNNQPMRSASIIKLFVLAALFEQVEKGEMDLTEQYVLKAEDKVSGTGDIQNMQDGTELTLLTLAEKMIIISDNTATNILINLIGGIEKVQNIIVELGYSDVQLKRLMVDLESLKAGEDNYMTAEDVGRILADIYQEKLVSKSASQKMLAILKQQTDRRMLAQNLPSDVTYYGKTGNFEDYGVQNDAAIIETPNGAFILVFLSQDGQKEQQLKAMNKLGKVVSELFIEIE
ncbi:serine hydrolase [Globicatella sulfidifaciens]|uniref:Serine hydrolase n=1 Tax=Globicatella sulfidifaciens TaxID=136093 RepID=A0A7X8H037_9LACT|nr:serine hydrolase [Globicatella sulfidifaciens]NLJ18328.1 serine hydrolase [Globicatella sulfidifaciens]